MVIAALTVSIVFGVFFSIIWNGSSALNVFIKVAFVLFTIFQIVTLIGVIAPVLNIPGSQIRVW